jgi:rare lipoprotein A
MVIRRKSSNMSMKTPLRICILAGVSSVALAAVVVSLATPAVHADAPLTKLAPTAPIASSVASATPDELTPQQPVQVRRGTRLHGIASWYGGLFHGRKTASGERFNMFAMTACHATLPFGSVVRVVNKDNKRSVVVRITDRGDLVDEGRIIDLSYAAAQKLAMTKDGLAKVDLQVISLGRSHGNK